MSRPSLRAASLALLLAGPLAAQQAPAASLAVTPPPATHLARVDSAQAARAPLFTYRDAIIGAAFVGATLAFAPLDRRIAHALQDSSTQANRRFHHAATDVELITSPGAYVIGAGMYAVGRIAHVPRATELAVHTTEAVLVGDATMGLLKGMAGRARPYVTGDTSARDFRFGRGFGSTDYSSFPSGHTTTAFAAAAAVTAETWGWWPRARWVVAPVLYGGASAVGLSRMYHNKHWASDVALGAGIGTFAGVKVVKFNHARPGNRLDRLLGVTSVGSDGRGGALSVSLPFGGPAR